MIKNKKKSFAALFAAVVVLAVSLMIPAGAATTGVFDTVLVLDVSGSMYSSLSEMRSAAKSACRDILNANPSNKIAVVSFGTYAYIDCDLTSDINTLESAIDNVWDDGLTNIYDACVLAKNMLDSSASTSSSKNVIIMTDGYPCEGQTMANGRYNSMFPTEDVEYQNAAYDYVSKNLHPMANVYASGFFDFNDNDPSSLYEDEKLAVQFVKDLANAKSYFPTNAGDVLQGAVDDVIANETTTAAPVTTTKPPVTTTKAPVTTTKAPVTTTAPATTTAPSTTAPAEAASDDPMLSSDIALAGTSGDSGSSTGAIVAVGAVATVGVGGLIALIIFLLTRKPTTPKTPIMTPVLMPISDDDDEDSTDKISPMGQDYSAPAGIGAFAAGAGASAAAEAYQGASVGGTLYGVSGSYRNSNIDMKPDETIYIGRDPSKCSLIITDDTDKVSRVHCTVAYKPSEGYVVTDMSKNGTFTKSSKLPYNVPTVFPEGTQIQLADSSNIFRLGY